MNVVLDSSDEDPNEDYDLSRMIDNVIHNAHGQMGANTEGVVDIITFCEHPKYLNFLGAEPQMKLWPMQKIVLKLFYRGTRGNEHVTLDDDEIRILTDITKNEDLDYIPTYGGFNQILDKYHRRETTFTVLELVMGRRSSKTLMVSIIAAYEAYKLLELKNPHAYYNMSPDKPIYIINVAVSEQQALDPLFVEIESRIARSPYFADKHSKASKKGVLYLLTENDKNVNAKRIKDGIDIMLDGSVVLLSGHSNSRSLRGKAAICILYDEFAHFQTTSGQSSGDAVFEALTPSTKQFGNDGKVVLLSDPKGKDGMFWRLFEMSQERELDPYGNVVLKDNLPILKHDNILAIQLPTWCMNPNKEFSKEKLTKEERAKDPIAYLTSWGAKFMGEQGMKFFPPEKLEDCVDGTWTEQKSGDPKYPYYLHLDPATTSHNYALVLCHPVTFVSTNHGGTKKKIYVDVVKFWKPSEKGPVDLTEVERMVIDLCRRFQIKTVTFDTFQSAQTIQRLKALGINAFETPFRAGYITSIYGELKNLVLQGDLVMPPHEQLQGEMKNLMYKIQQRGIKKFFDIKSSFPSDDCCDALAGSVFQALNNQINGGLPRSGVVYLPGR
jgi:hypothetical protein